MMTCTSTRLRRLDAEAPTPPGTVPVEVEALAAARAAGEALDARNAYLALTSREQADLIEFLKRASVREAE